MTKIKRRDFLTIGGAAAAGTALGRITAPGEPPSGRVGQVSKCNRFKRWKLCDSACCRTTGQFHAKYPAGGLCIYWTADLPLTRQCKLMRYPEMVDALSAEERERFVKNCLSWPETNAGGPPGDGQRGCCWKAKG